MPDETVYPSLDPNKNDGYLSIATLPSLANLPVMSAPFAHMLPALDEDKNDGYPCHSWAPDLITLLVQARPFPRMMPGLDSTKNDGYPSFSGFTYPILVQKRPFPKMMPSLETTGRDKGYPTFRHDEPGFGAFANVPTLNKATIPQTVKFIADYTFYNTSLEKVKIARDCMYFEHTFPPDCVITYDE